MMVDQSTIISGFGGQGVILAGKTLARSGMEKGLEVTWLPSYGPEMRGGTANCTVIISSELIGSPIVDQPQVLITFNKPSLDKFGSQVQSDGTIIVNSSLVDELPDLSQVNLLEVPLNDLAQEVGSQKATNMVALGAWAQAVDGLDCDDVITGMSKLLTEMGKEDFVELNTEALRKGFETSRG